MSRRIDDPGVHNQLRLFFDIMELLYTNDKPANYNLDPKIKQIAFSSEQLSEDYFQNIIDQPAFMTDDHKRVREFLVDWYASNRTLVRRAKEGRDVFSLSNDELNELISSFGFPYPQRVISNKNKALFLLDLVNLYNKKGTPEALANSLTYFGLTNIVLSEWWIKNKSGTFIAESQPILPKGARANQTQTLSYNTFIASDPFWHLTETELAAKYATSVITLPSITPHFSIDASLVINTIYPALSILTKKMQESYDYWLLNGELYQDIYMERYGRYVSFLELALSVGYIFDGLFDSEDKGIQMFQGTIDNNGDGIDDYPYEDVIAEYEELHTRSENMTRERRDENYETYQSRFIGESSEFFLQTNSDLGSYLALINPDLKVLIDEDIAADKDKALESVLGILDGHLSTTLQLIDFSFSYLVNGSSTYERLKPIINFFKPYRSRIREFLTSFLFDDPLNNSALLKDRLFQGLSHSATDYLLDLQDSLFTQIYQKLTSSVGSTWDGLDNIIHDIPFYTIIQNITENIVYNELLTKIITQQLSDVSSVTDNLISSVNELSTDKLFTGTGRLIDDVYMDSVYHEVNEQVVVDDAISSITESLMFVDQGIFGLDDAMISDSPQHAAMQIEVEELVLTDQIQIQIIDL